MSENSTPNHAAVSLPAGSFDLQALSSGLDTAAQAGDGDHESAVSKAVADARLDDADDRDLSLRADQKVVETTREDLGVTEKVRTFDPDSDAAVAAAPGDQLLEQTVKELKGDLPNITDLAKLREMRSAETRPTATSAIDARIAELEAATKTAEGE